MFNYASPNFLFYFIILTPSALKSFTVSWHIHNALMQFCFMSLKKKNCLSHLESRGWLEGRIAILIVELKKFFLSLLSALELIPAVTAANIVMTVCFFS